MDAKLLALTVLCVIFAVQYVFSASVATSTTVHHHHTTKRNHGNHGHHNRPTHSTEKIENDMITFHYDTYAIEKLLVAKKSYTCYAYPLSDDESHDIHDALKLFKLEAHLIHQIKEKAYGNWTYDDLSVRSNYFGHFCSKNSTVYRVYRV